jgi:hypothetical protein
LEGQALTILHGKVGGIILGSVFLFIGLAACVIAAVRGRGGVRLLVWFGIFSAMYGARILAQTPAAFSVLPQSTWTSRQWVIACLSPQLSEATQSTAETRQARGPTHRGTDPYYPHWVVLKPDRIDITRLRCRPRLG